jgi:hypothetical protein
MTSSSTIKDLLRIPRFDPCDRPKGLRLYTSCILSDEQLASEKIDQTLNFLLSFKGGNHQSVFSFRKRLAGGRSIYFSGEEDSERLAEDLVLFIKFLSRGKLRLVGDSIISDL